MIFGILILFLPGFLVLPSETYEKLSQGDWCDVCFGALGLLFFPITMVLNAFVFIFRACSNDISVNKMTVSMTGGEAFFGCFPQLVFQGVSIIYGYETNGVQTLVILASFILLTKTSIAFDIICNEKELSVKKSIIRAIKVLPCYVTTVIFRLSSFTLTIAFLRNWSAIPFIVLLVELIFIIIDKYKDLQVQKVEVTWKILCDFKLFI